MKPSRKVLALAARSVMTRKQIREVAVETPCLQSRRDKPAIAGLYFKCENFQKTGSFKIRGALSRLSAVPAGEPVITASSGNHGIACSYAASTTGHKLTVVLPEAVDKAKLNQIQSYGTETILHPGDSGLAERHARSLAEKTGKLYISPYNDELVMAGQGTIALELLEQLPQINNIFISLGGGGLVSGTGAVLKAYSPETKIIGVSAINSGALAASLTAGRIIDTEHLETLADGCAGGIDHNALTFPIAAEVIDRVVHCSETQIADAVHHLAWKERLIVEGAAALAMAGYLAEAECYEGKCNVVLLCGSNFDTEVIRPILLRDE
ncbi:threonine dehydratase [Chromatiales bacterium (ex Bugula neritina AB1)]|nr:threonine dehydratase [Chromatiales bacterium (ex Bugula neritina AB1)]